ncbi:MAG: hypothetical protein FWG38_06260, partial [Defluviitaleaceae bacterium]|nr:hypothetical protein [Defluviitaleaceae bacterium]
MNAQYVWFQGEDTSRNPYAAFRRNFTVDNTQNVQQATLHLFADTVYALYVNGAFVGFGPARFDPRFPQYDTYDLKEYLRDGNNVIAVLVNFHGHKVFKSIPAQAAMIAWGEVEEAGKITDLSTGLSKLPKEEPWKSLRHTAYDRYTPKLGFALNARIHYEPTGFDENWNLPDYNDAHWPAAVPLQNQHAFGKLTPREIPFMEMTDVAPVGITLLSHIKTETLYSFFLPLPFGYDTAFDLQEKYSKFMAWKTYIYSPCKQAVTVGCLYEQIWVNGKPAGGGTPDPFLPVRYNKTLALEAGWNYVFGQSDIFQDIYECYLALPDNRGLVLSADKDPRGGLWFKHIPILPMARDGELRGQPLPWPEDVDAELFGGWIHAENGAQSPCREVSWDMYGPAAHTLDIKDVQANGLVIKKDLHPHGFSLIFDMGHMRLLFPTITLSGVKGADIDLLYGDRFMDDGQHLRSLSWVPLGDRIAGAGDTLSWTPIQPRGFRYLNVTVRNAPGDVRGSVSFLSAQYPVKHIGHFECSDPLLNRIWAMGALTQSIDMEDAYVDCVDRERGLYALDALIQYHNNLVCFGDHALMKRTMELYGQSAHETGLFRCLYPNEGHYIIPDFSLYIVEAFYRYYLYTGDTSLTAAYWPAIMDNLRAFFRLSDEREDMLLDATKPAGDWPRNPEDNRTGFYGDGEQMENTGINSIFTSLYLTALQAALKMAETLPPTEKINEDILNLKHRIAILEVSIPNAFWDEEKGLFADNTTHQRFSPHASLFALKAGVVSPAKRERLRQNLPTLLTPFFANGYDHTNGVAFSPSYAFYMLDALYELGLDQCAEACIRDGWRYFIDKGMLTTPEFFSLDE